MCLSSYKNTLLIELMFVIVYYYLLQLLNGWT